MTDHPSGSGSLAVGALWLMTAKTLAFILSFAVPLLLVRRLDQFEFGLYKQTFLVVGTALAVLPLGFGMSAYYFLPRERARQGQVVFNILLFNVVVGSLAWVALVLWPTLLTSILGQTPLVAYGPQIGFVILLLLVAALLEVVAIAHQEIRLATVFIVGANVTRSATLAVAAVLVGTIEALIYAAVIHGALQTAVLLVYLRARFGRFWRHFEWSMLRRQLAYALPLGVAGLLYVLQLELHNYLVSHQFGAALLAVYMIGCFQLPVIGILQESVNSVMIPRVSYLQKAEGHREVLTLVAAAMRKLAAPYFAIYAFLIVMGREVIVFLFTETYLASWPIFAINLTLVPFAILVTDPIMRAYADHRFFLIKLRVVMLALFIAIWLAVRQQLDLTGMIATVVTMKLVEWLVTAAKAARIVGAGREDAVLLGDVGKLAISAAAAGLATAAVRALIWPGAGLVAGLIVCGLVFAFVYVATVLMLGTLTDDERRWMRRQLERLQRRWPRRRPADHPA